MANNMDNLKQNYWSVCLNSNKIDFNKNDRDFEIKISQVSKKCYDDIKCEIAKLVFWFIRVNLCYH